MNPALKKFLIVCAGVFLVAGVAALALSKPRPEPKLTPHQQAISKIITSYVGVQMILSEQIYVGEREELHRTVMDLYHAVEEAATLYVPGDADAWTNMTLDMRVAMGPVLAWGDVKIARELFKKASDRLILIIEKFGHAHSQNLYVMYCPMAFDDTGACWIQGADQPRNPYFGKKMLECGTVKKVFPARK